jgi:hypothetical protein
LYVFKNSQGQSGSVVDAPWFCVVVSVKKEVVMRCSRVVFAALLVLALAGVAQANTINDPVIIVAPPPGGDAILLLPGQLSVNLTFNTDAKCSAPNATSMVCNVINDTNHPLKALSFFFGTPQTLTLTSTSFGTWSQNSNGTVAKFKFTPALPDSEVTGAVMTFQGFASGLQFKVMATRAPEPATFGLLVCGLGALLFQRRARKPIS